MGFHIRDLTCGLNDPNGPVYDPKHGVYHLFYQVYGCVFAALRVAALNHHSTESGHLMATPPTLQDHLGTGGNGGTSWGHVASRDLKKWTHLPVALWNDHPCHLRNPGWSLKILT